MGGSCFMLVFFCIFFIFSNSTNSNQFVKKHKLVIFNLEIELLSLISPIQGIVHQKHESFQRDFFNDFNV